MSQTDQEPQGSPPSADAPASAPPGKRLKLAVRLVLSLVLLVGVVAWVGPEKILATVRQAHPAWLPAVLALVLLHWALGPARVLVLVRAVAPAFPTGVVFRAQLKAASLGMISPAKVGELSFPYFLAKGGVSHGVGLAILVCDRGITLALLALTGGAALLFFAGPGPAALASGCALLMLGVAYLLLRSETLSRWLRERLLRKRAESFAGFSANVKALLRDHPAAVGGNVLISFLRIVTRGGIVSVGALAFGDRIDLLPAIGIVAMIQLVGVVPVSFSGLGLIHGAAVLLFSSLCGADPAVVLNLFLFLSVLSYALAALVLTLL